MRSSEHARFTRENEDDNVLFNSYSAQFESDPLASFLAVALWPSGKPTLRVFTGCEPASCSRENLQFRLPLLRVWLDTLQEDSSELLSDSGTAGRDSKRESPDTGSNDLAFPGASEHG